MSIAVILVAAGRGHRFGGDTPKQYVPLSGTCALRRSAEAFLALEPIRQLRTVIHPDDQTLYADAMASLSDPRLLDPVPGGDTRAQSVRLGLESLQDTAPDLVLIHDAARPFVPTQVITGVIEALATSAGAFAALPVVDALWASDADHATKPVPRDGLWRAQTPQGFRFQDILSAHQSHNGSGADDVAVAREAGLDVALVFGSESNFKITTGADLERARTEIALQNRPTPG